MKAAVPYRACRAARTEEGTATSLPATLGPEVSNAYALTALEWWIVDRLTPEQVKPALNEAFTHPGPALIDVAVARQELSLPPSASPRLQASTCI